MPIKTTPTRDWVGWDECVSRGGGVRGVRGVRGVPGREEKGMEWNGIGWDGMVRGDRGTSSLVMRMG
ncbi:hypothetical protein M0802_004134 [Mischocyttarus mexicanus]|nr:hypothetical protein M0802_004134 [Mischocyttarus mexicanus]